MPNQQIENNQVEQLKIQVYGPDSQQSSATRQGSVSITGNPLITALSPINISGTYNAQVSIVNSNVSISTSSLMSLSTLNNILMTGSAGVSGSATLNHSVTQITQSFPYSIGVLGTTVINSIPIDVSPYKKYSFYVQTSGEALSSFSATLQIAPLTSMPYLNTSSNTTSPAILTTTQFLRYARVSTQLGSTLGTTSRMLTVIFQAQR